MIVGAQFLTGALMITEEKIVKKYQIDPLLTVGLEGFWGCIFMAILLPIYQNLSCEGSLCSNGVIEDSSLAFQEIANTPILILWIFAGMLSLGGFNASGVTVTKNASASQRATIDSTRTLIIWAISLAIGWETFHVMQLVGFFLLVNGTLVYNEIIDVPFLSKRKARNF